MTETFLDELSFRPELDPRLRRLSYALRRPESLSMQLERPAVFTLEDVDPAVGPTNAADVRTKVLVLLGRSDVHPGDAGGPSAEGSTWARVVDDIWSVELPAADLEQLAAHPDVRFIEASRPFAPMLDTSVSETKADQLRTVARGGLTGAGIVVGIVDVGLDFTLDDFRNADGTTRVAYLWDQDLEAGAGEAAPTDFPYGVEYDAAAIDAALQAPNPFAVVRHQPEEASHGTHVAGIAAGNGRTASPAFPAGAYVGVAPEATIVFVQPASNDAETTFTDSGHVADAIAYVFARAQELGLPCVVNMSLGQNGGSHDGESVVERAVDRLLETEGRVVTLAAGNEHTWRGHASGRLDAGEVRTLRWKFGGQMPTSSGGVTSAGLGDRTPNEVEVWYSSRDLIDVVLVDPSGERSMTVSPGTTAAHTFATGELGFIDSERFSRLNGDARIYIEVSRPGGGTLTSGEWLIELTAVEAPEGRFDAWIERDTRDSANGFADQSFFVGADFDPVMTPGTPATARRAISVANYDHHTVAPSDSSSRGPTRDGRRKPEIAAPGTRIMSSGALGGRTRGGRTVPVRVEKSGTSMAAPHVAGIAALLLQAQPKLVAGQLTKMLIAAADPPPGVTVFDIAWGFGRVDAARAHEVLLGPP